MRTIAIAHHIRNLAEFEKVLRDYKDGQFLVCPTPSRTNGPYQSSRPIRQFVLTLPHYTIPYCSKTYCVSSNYTLLSNLTTWRSKSAKAGKRSKQSKEFSPNVLPQIDTRRLSQMILDKVFHRVLDQGRGCLLVYDKPEVGVRFPCMIECVAHAVGRTCGAAIDTLEQVGKVADSLYAKVRPMSCISFTQCNNGYA